MKQESLNFKCEQFFGKNWKYIFFGIILGCFVIALEIHSISNRMESLEQIVLDNNGKVVFATSDGRAIKVTKTPLKAEYLKQFAISTYVNNFIYSRAQLTNDFSKPNFTKYSDILENAPNLALIFREYINKEDKQAIGDLIAYLQWLMSAIAQDKLPEYIAIKDSSVNAYEYSANHFKISLEIKVIAQSFIIAKNEYVNQNGVIKIVSEGSFDLTKSSDANPYGLRIKRFSIVVPTKDNQ
ncbi:hypothetical protein CCZ01_09335 [Helicobacter monodelphidis]|uniref:hypothetical protein n=1 Tax=Helicobacter sp. 15-1451 TaxID=2004995 RepID=UPI000DCAEA09|nr:hypothetical protein [Helicobacter sp. 15-1451]RAX56487.1 hypothetical protein CCZ01_09335 [Helicobacter sp. 15-1451]